jgi:hypothetical protein
LNIMVKSPGCPLDAALSAPEEGASAAGAAEPASGVTGGAAPRSAELNIIVKSPGASAGAGAAAGDGAATGAGDDADAGCERWAITSSRTFSNSPGWKNLVNSPGSMAEPDF